MIHGQTLDCRVASRLSMNRLIGAVCCAEARALDRSKSVHRPAAGEALFRAERAQNALRRVARRFGCFAAAAATRPTPSLRSVGVMPHRRHRYASCATMSAHGARPWAPAQRGEAMPRLIRFAPALLAECGPAATRASLPSVAARPRSLRSLRLHFAATRLARSNKGALLPHSAAMLGVLYGALSHLARASRRYSSAFPFHPTDMSQCAVVARVAAQRAATRGTA